MSDLGYQPTLFEGQPGSLPAGTCPQSGKNPAKNGYHRQAYPCDTCGRLVMIRTDAKLSRHQVPKERVL